MAYASENPRDDDVETPSSSGSGDRSSWLEQIIGYMVIDRDEEKIGTVECVYEDTSGQPAFIGVRTGWLGMGSIHVVPAEDVHLTEKRRKLRLPYSVEAVRDAPSFADDATIDGDTEERICAYYEGYGFRRRRGGSDVEVEAQAAESPRATEETAAPPLAQHVQPQPADAPMSSGGDDDRSLLLKEEQLQVGKREVEYGGVRIRKIVRTEVVNQPVELKTEEVIVERVPVSGTDVGDVTGDDASFSEEEIYIPLRREEPVVAKQARIKEQVRMRKEDTTRQQDVSETVRSEDVEIEKTPGTEARPRSGSQPFPVKTPQEPEQRQP